MDLSVDAQRLLEALLHPPELSPDSTEPVGVFQLLADAVAVDLVVLPAGGASEFRIVSRTRSRSSVSLWVPRMVPLAGAMVPTAAGVMVGSSQGQLQSGRGAPLSVGDSATVDSRAGLWVGLQPGARAGYVCYLHCWDPVGGALDD